jgi:hypothetical protein
MKKLTSIILFALLLCTTNLSFAQEPTLTKKQMYKDFDQLVRIIEDCNVQLPVRKLITGIDNLKEIKKLRNNIDTITNFESFRQLISDAIYLVKDPHIDITTTYYPEFDKLNNIDTTAINQLNQFFNSREKRNERMIYHFKNYSPIPAIKIEGNYYYYGNFIFHNQNKDSLKIHFMKLLTYNGQEFQKYVDENFQGNIWDYDKKKYIYPYVRLKKDAVIEGEQDGIRYKFNLNDYPMVDMGSIITNIELKGIPKRKEWDDNKIVKYIERDSILYIYLPTMVTGNGDSLFYSQIKHIGKGKKINKVVIDVRGNSGGDDLTWYNTLKAIVKDTLPYKVKLAFNDSRKMREYYSNDYEVEKIKWLDNKKLRIINIDTYLAPDTNSINFDGKIFILSDAGTYSAGHSIVTYADQLKQLVSIGTKTGHIVGFGLMAPLFQLNNSKLAFRLACVMDITNCKKPIDVYHDTKEIEIFPTFEERVYTLTDLDTKSEEYLYKYDSWFRKVLELE